MTILYQRMPVIYVAGPYTALTAMEVEGHVHNARVVGQWLASIGFSPLIPHSNTAGFDGPSAFWYSATAELLRRCDGIVVLPGSERSAGTQHEIQLAEKLGMFALHIGITPKPDIALLKFRKNWLEKLNGSTTNGTCK